jgi:hypothetical protein
MRLRQVALVARELEPVVDDLGAVLGLEVAFRDPGVAEFGLRNAIFAIGDTFLEVVSPVRPDATAARFLERRGGDGGYMAIFQTTDLGAARARLERLGVRIVWEIAFDDIATIHLHPRDVGGAIVSLDEARPASRGAGRDRIGSVTRGASACSRSRASTSRATIPRGSASAGPGARPIARSIAKPNRRRRRRSRRPSEGRGGSDVRDRSRARPRALRPRGRRPRRRHRRGPPRGRGCGGRARGGAQARLPRRLGRARHRRRAIRACRPRLMAARAMSSAGHGRRHPIELVDRIWSTDEGLTALLFLLVLHLFVLFPLSEHWPAARSLLELGFSLILISGATAVTGRRWTSWAVIAFAIASLCIQWTYRWTGNPNLLPCVIASALGYCALLAGVVFAQIARGTEITRHHVQGAIAGFLLLGMAWAFAYRLLQFIDPHAIAIPHPIPRAGDDVLTGEMIYFSFVTLTTVGYGDITATDPVARSLVILEALTGQLFPAVLLARLVSLEIHNRTQQSLRDRAQRLTPNRRRSRLACFCPRSGRDARLHVTARAVLDQGRVQQEDAAHLLDGHRVRLRRVAGDDHDLALDVFAVCARVRHHAVVVLRERQIAAHRDDRVARDARRDRELAQRLHERVGRDMLSTAVGMVSEVRRASAERFLVRTLVPRRSRFVGSLTTFRTRKFTSSPCDSCRDAGRDEHHPATPRGSGSTNRASRTRSRSSASRSISSIGLRSELRQKRSRRVDRRHLGEQPP